MRSNNRCWHLELQVGGVHKQYYVGDEMQRKRGMLRLSFPVVKGVVQDWDDMEKIW